MLTKLMEEIAPFIEVSFEENPSAEKVEEQLIVSDTGHSCDGGKVRHAFKRFMKEDYPELYEKVEIHTGTTFYKATERTPPFVVMMVASGIITPEQYVKMITDASSDAKIIINAVEPEEYVESVWNTYRKFKEFKTKMTDTPIEIKVMKIPELSKDSLKIIDSVLTGFGLPAWNEFEKGLKASEEAAKVIERSKKETEAISKEFHDKEREFLKTLSSLQKEIASKPFKEAVVKGDGSIPSGKIVMKPINDVFPVSTKASFDIPVWEWDGPHPDVPSIDPHYIFREDLLVRALYAIVSNQRMYLQGHTGTGKTTLIEQIAAYLNWPFMRINFDSEITRMDLIGRDTLKDGKSVFVDGVLPRMMTQPYIGVFDEIDFCRPDVAYVMQSVLEGNSFRITEDGGRLVEPNPMFRMFATGNTVGQGDEHGMYQGARPQSLAFLDRFTVWGKVDYLKDSERLELLKRHLPGLSDAETTIISKYTTEHLAAFTDAKILQPISPRGMLAIGKAVCHLNAVFPGRKQNIKEALTMVVLDRATQADHQVIHGIIDRVVRG